jgi:hypothetical protein
LFYCNRLLHFLDLFSAKIELNNDQSTSFKYENLNTSLVNVNFHQWNQEEKNNEWFTIKSGSFIDQRKFYFISFCSCIENSDDHPNSIIQLNLRALRVQTESIDNYRIIETIFSNFNLFPQMNKTNQTNENSSRLIGVPISYQIANWTRIKINEDLVRFQIRVSEVRKYRFKSFISFNFNRKFKCVNYHVFIGHLMKIMDHG